MEQILPKGTVLKFMGHIPFELLEDTKVFCGTDLKQAQDFLLSFPRRVEPPDAGDNSLWKLD